MFLSPFVQFFYLLNTPSRFLTEYLWRAPELLRMANPPPCGTEKGDVFSFAIILQECHTRQGPWSGSGISNKGTC